VYEVSQLERPLNPWTRFARKALPMVLVPLAAGFTFFALHPPELPVAVPAPVEIEEYEGEALGSVSDFPENSILGVQTIDAATYRLVIDGLVERTVSLALDDLAAMDRAERLVTIHCVEGWSVRALWEGIPVAVLVDLAEPHAEATTVIFHAVDGYTTSLPLARIIDRNLILADRINGIPLPPANGYPFQLVAEDRWGYKWIRWVTRVELSDDEDYRGFWEQRGYSNGGELDGPMREGDN